MGLELSTTKDTIATEDAGRRIEILDETGMPYLDPETKKPITALVAGTYSKRFTTAQRKQQEKLSRAAASKLTPEQKDANSRALFAECVIEWDLLMNGVMAPPADVFRIKPHIYDQIVNAATEHAGFFEPSSTL